MTPATTPDDDSIDQGVGDRTSLDDPTWLSEIERSLEHLSLIDADDRLVFVNRLLPQIADYVGGSVFDVIEPAGHDAARRAMDMARESGLPQHYETEVTSQLGRSLHVSNWVFAMPTATDPQMLGIVTSDITAERRTRSALELSESTLRSLVDNAPVSILIADRDRRIQFVNRLEFGFSEDVIGTFVETFVPPEFREIVIDAVDSVFETGQSTSYETSLETPDGWRHFETRVGPIILDGAVGRVSLIATDITDRHEVEQARERLRAELQQAQKMDALGQLTGGVAHDFNNLLMAISGNLELALLGNQPGQDSTRHIEASLRAVESATELTTRLLLFSRKGPLDPRPADANELVSGMLTILKRTLGEGIEVRAALDPALWFCEVDRGQLEQAILNLAVNARDAMSSGGQLNISTENVTIDESDSAVPSGQFVQLTVSDDGEGMTDEVAARAFEPFFTTKEVGKGTGLGLSTIYGFVMQSGGQMTIDSTPDAGTSVRLLLPRASEAVRSSEVEEQTAAVARPAEVVLIVEDQDEVRNLSAEMIEHLGYRVLTAPDADMALDLLAAHPDVDVVFTDIGLPGEMNGFEFAARVAASGGTVPFVFTSGYPEGAGLVSAVSADTTLLRKPFSLQDVAAALRQALDDAAR